MARGTVLQMVEVAPKNFKKIWDIIENALCIQVSVAIITYYLVIIIQLICI